MMQRILTPLLLLFVGALLSMMLTRSCQVEPPLPEMMVLRDTITEVYIDTHTVNKPVPYKVDVRDTIYINGNINDTINGNINDTINGNIFVQEVKEYKDSTYYAKVSGINANLEEIRVFPKYSTVYINTTEKVYIKPKEWELGLQGGVGITPKGVQPYIGFGVTKKIKF